MTTTEEARNAALQNEPKTSNVGGKGPDGSNESIKQPSPKQAKSFLPTSTRATTAINDGVLPDKLGQTAKQTGMAVPRATNATMQHVMENHRIGQSFAGSEPSAVPSVRNRPRRESIGQMRRKASDSATAAGSAGGLPHVFPGRGQPIPSVRSASRGFSTSPRPDGANSGHGASSLSTSLGSAADALSLPASVLNSGAKSGRPTGHTHFGQECYGPEPGETVPNPPSNLSKSAVGSTPASAPNGNNAPSVLQPMARDMERRSSISESVNGDDESSSSARMANGKELPVHRCERCNKIYRHPSCLIKHRWEHTVYWKEASKFLMSKHQQVQLLEAAAILVNLDGDAASLPDEKALWPAAVSPAASGLLGSDKVNFDKMMQRKVAMRGPRRGSDASTIMSPSVSAQDLSSERGASPANNSGMARSASAGLSPLNSFTQLGLNSTPVSRPANGAHSYSYNSLPYSYGSKTTSDIQHLALDESDERSSTKGGDDDDEDDDDDEYEEGEGRSSGRDTSISAESPDDYDDPSSNKDGDKQWGLHEDAVADMDMEE